MQLRLTSLFVGYYYFYQINSNLYVNIQYIYDYLTNLTENINILTEQSINFLPSKSSRTLKVSTKADSKGESHFHEKRNERT